MDGIGQVSGIVNLNSIGAETSGYRLVIGFDELRRYAASFGLILPHHA